MIRNATKLLAQIRAIHAAIRDAAMAACEEQTDTASAETNDNTIVAFDRQFEKVLLDRFTALAREWSFVLVAKGLGPNGL